MTAERMHRDGPLHECLETWFAEKFGSPTDVQREAWGRIRGGKHTLIAAPTGSGKTLAALLPCVSMIQDEKSETTETVPGVRLLYITPLKALNNDVHAHLLAYMEDWNALATERGCSWHPLMGTVRTGDTSSRDRNKMLRRPPEVLVTTPESLYLLLSSAKGRSMLRTVQAVIVDEIHDLAGDLRGTHLSVSLERLEHLIQRPLQRIGVSATQRPIERIAAFLGGCDASGAVRSVEIVQSRVEKRVALQVATVAADLARRDSNGIWLPIVDRILRELDAARSIIVFVNNRRLCERLTLRINEYAGCEIARGHHGSVSKERRHEAEQMLKRGELRCIVATSSLELGIDVGFVDLVLQIDSPKGVAAGIQRIGRAGHQVNGESRGIVLVKNRGELPEVAVIGQRMMERRIEETEVPTDRIEVLAQQIVAMVAVDDWEADALFELVKRAYGFASLSRARFDALVAVLTGFFPFARPLLDLDVARGLLTRLGITSVAALTGVGTIPSSSGFPVYDQERGVHVGELDEEFVNESRVGDVFQLGAAPWRIQSIRGDRVLASSGGGRLGEVPFWKGGGPGRSFELSQEVGAFLGRMEEQLGLASRLQSPASKESGHAVEVHRAVRDWLQASFCFDEEAAAYLVHHVMHQADVSTVPTDRRLVVERFEDDMGQTHVILHTCFGARVNRTWMLALRRRFEKTLPYRFYAYAKDGGLEFIFPDWEAGMLDAFWQLDAQSAEALIREALPSSPLFAVTFRHMAETALLLARGFKRSPIAQKRLRSEALLREAMGFADQFPLVADALNRCLIEELDLPRLGRVLTDLRAGKLELAVRALQTPSPFGRQFLSDFAQEKLYEAEQLSLDLQLSLMAISPSMVADTLGPVSVQHVLTDEIVNAFQLEQDRDAEFMRKDPDGEIAGLLKRRGDQSEAELRNRFSTDDVVAWVQSALQRGTAAAWTAARETRFICADESALYGVLTEKIPVNCEKLDSESQFAMTFILRRYAQQQVGFTASELGARYSLSPALCAELCERWLAEKWIESVPWADPDSGAEPQWITADMARRLRRFGLARARERAHVRVEPGQYAAWVSLHHHAAPGHRLRGPEGVLRVIEQLEGEPFTVSQWETSLLPSRIESYSPTDLDFLCATGQVRWVGAWDPEQREGKVALYTGDASAPFGVYRTSAPAAMTPLEEQLLAVLTREGAAFLTHVALACGVTPSEAHEGLLSLAWQGRVSNDQFAPLRHKAVPGPRSTRRRKPLSVGRWYALPEAANVERSREEQALHLANKLLDRYGIVARGVMPNYSPFTWDTLSGVYRRLEEMGVVSSGFFLDDVRALQFARLDALRSFSGKDPASQQAPIILCANDPANVFGLLLDWPESTRVHFARKAGCALVLKDQQPLLWIENGGKRLYDLREEVGKGADTAAWSTSLLQEILVDFARQTGKRKLILESWNGTPIVDSEAGQLLQEMGAERDHNRRLTLWTTRLARQEESVRG